MEKIQEAIAKARAARPEAAPSVTPGGMMDAERTVPPMRPNASTTRSRSGASLPQITKTRTEVAWAELPIFEPAAKHLNRNRILTHGRAKAGRHTKEIADFDAIRTRVLQLQKANDWKRIAVTSPTRGCGTSTLTLNLALSMARQNDRQTILADLNIRAPALNRLLGQTKRQDIAAVLEDKENFAEHASRIGETLAIAGACVRPHGAAELFQSNSTSRVLDRIEETYEPSLMLFDLPAMLGNDDAAAFMGQVDAVILVAAAETTSIKQIDTCERQIADLSNPMGVVLTNCRYMNRDG